MKLKIITAVLLFFCFLWMALLVGAIPVLTEARASTEYIQPEPSDPPEAADTPAPTSETPPTPSPVPEPTPTPAPAEPAEPETPQDEEEDGDVEEPEPRVISTTITGESLLDNDTEYELDAGELLEEELTQTLPAEGCQILIVHTHATEAYMPDSENDYEPSDDYRTTDPAFSVIRVGEELARALTDQGLQVIHDTGLHDYPSYNGSYARSGEAIEEYLAAYPNIGVVIDLHRDALGDGDVMYKTVAEADGAETAQLMFVMGTDMNLDHPGWRDNLKLALTLQQAVRERWPELMRPTVVCQYRYNQQLTSGSLLLEVGTSGNSLEEAIRAVQRFAEAAGPVFLSLTEE